MEISLVTRCTTLLRAGFSAMVISLVWMLFPVRRESDEGR
jgi:hypothetical protein